MNKVQYIWLRYDTIGNVPFKIIEGKSGGKVGRWEGGKVGRGGKGMP
jgi:SLT domain-containing protein